MQHPDRFIEGMVIDIAHRHIENIPFQVFHRRRKRIGHKFPQGLQSDIMGRSFGGIGQLAQRSDAFLMVPDNARFRDRSVKTRNEQHIALPLRQFTDSQTHFTGDTNISRFVFKNFPVCQIATPGKLDQKMTRRPCVRQGSIRIPQAVLVLRHQKFGCFPLNGRRSCRQHAMLFKVFHKILAPLKNFLDRKPPIDPERRFFA